LNKFVRVIKHDEFAPPHHKCYSPGIADNYFMMIVCDPPLRGNFHT